MRPILCPVKQGNNAITRREINREFLVKDNHKLCRIKLEFSRIPLFPSFPVRPRTEQLCSVHQIGPIVHPILSHILEPLLSSITLLDLSQVFRKDPF